MRQKESEDADRRGGAEQRRDRWRMAEFKRKKRRAAGACCRRANTSVTVIELIIGIDTLKIKARSFFFFEKNCTNCLLKKKI